MPALKLGWGPHKDSSHGPADNISAFLYRVLERTQSPLSLPSPPRQADDVAGADDAEKERRRQALLERAEALQSQKADLDSELAELAAEAAAVISDAEREQLRNVLGNIGGGDEVQPKTLACFHRRCRLHWVSRATAPERRMRSALC